MWSRCAVLGSGHVSFEAPGSCGAPEMNPCPGKAAALGLTDPTWINPVGFATVEWFQETTSILQSVLQLYPTPPCCPGVMRNRRAKPCLAGGGSLRAGKGLGGARHQEKQTCRSRCHEVVLKMK